ncbi:MAG: NosR/NirI family nitrous oxide reductase transcriptional regulator [Myxococcota bacterium]|jgi:NosR/NirI family nitrous oxide reductase transcriptional regulator
MFLVFSALLAFAQESALHITGRHDAAPVVLDCATQPCASVLEAHRFETVEGKPYAAAFAADGSPAGWVALSSEVVDIKGYSSKPLHTLVGLGTDGRLTGANVLYHSEPILLVGIPEADFVAFVDAHAGIRADEKVVVGRSATDAHQVDAISGATVTVLAESRTIMQTARVLAEDVGVIKGASRVPGHLVDGPPLTTWDALVSSGALGRLTVHASKVGRAPAADGRSYIDLWFGVVDNRQVGVPLVGEGTWTWSMEQLAEDEHLLVVFNQGETSFKGSGFVRGGLFDRFQIEQGLRTITFRDMDYQSMPGPTVPGSPSFWEGGLFVVRDDMLDLGATYQFVVLASEYATERGAFQRDFFSFGASHRVPRNLYMLDGPDPEQAVWREAWAIGGWRAGIVVGFYLWVGGLFAARRWMSGSMPRLQRLHVTTMAASFFVLGLWLHVQPSITQLLTLVGSTKTGWSWDLYLSDPTLFVSWIGIAVLGIVWGRGTFCGWLCPYGSLAELLFKLGRKVGIPELEFSDAIHDKARYLRYLVFGVLLAAFLYKAELGEVMAEVEPFKSTFFVPLWTRHWTLVLWWTVLAVWSATTFRPFCRYICPLGAALAVPSTFRLSGPYRREFCTKCTICAKGCEPRAIRPDGSIDPRECLNCWECEANWRNDEVCPPLVRAKRGLKKKAKVS